MNDASYLPVNWPDSKAGKPENVFAVTTLINGGASKGDYSGFNLASHVGDDPAAVSANREKLIAELKLPSQPVWLDQVHSNKVIRADDLPVAGPASEMPILKADASISGTKGVVCAVLTADCLPVFLCNRAGTEVAVAHAGWRGLNDGIISQTVAAMKSTADELLASLGPAIGPQAFEVGSEVFDAFVGKNQINASAFIATDKDHYLCDIYQLARIELSALGVANISGGDHCTYNESDRFYSYRRQKNSGRMASLIWFE